MVPMATTIIDAKLYVPEKLYRLTSFEAIKTIKDMIQTND